MKPTIITKDALRKIVREVLDSPSLEAYVPDVKATNVNPVVDPSAAITDPMNSTFKPQNRTELGVAMNDLTKGMDDSEVPALYDAVKSALGDQEQSKEEDDKVKSPEETKPTTGTKSGTKAEGILRRLVRNAIREQYDDYDAVVSGGPGDFLDDPAPAPEVKDDITFEDLAKQMGLKVSGAKQFVDKAVARMKFINNEYEANPQRTQGHNLNDMGILIMVAFRDYIEKLDGTGELSPADVQFLKDHPEAALEMEGFREFLHPYIRRSMTTPGFDGPYQKAEKFAGDYDWMDDEEPGGEYEKVKRNAANHLLKSLGMKKSKETGDYEADEPDEHMKDYLRQYAPDEGDTSDVENLDDYARERKTSLPKKRGTK